MFRLVRAVMRFFFRLLYNEFAWSYDAVSAVVSMGQWRAWQRTALSRLRGGRVLEIAHGTGNLLLDLSALGFQPFGLDLSPAMGRLAARKIAQTGLASPLLRARVQALPFADASFPSLLSTFPAEFIVQPAAIAEFYRLLQPGGVFVCVPAAQITGPALPDRAADWLFRVTGQSGGDWFEPLLTRYADAGFAARLEHVRLPRSTVIVLLAEKSSSHPPLSLWERGRR
jgi:ubiquinone/menaquinone biosynthesis C-methylase UbiE